VEQFFPGLSKKTIESTDVKINYDPIQIFIISSSNGFGYKIQQLFLDLNPFLNIEFFSDLSIIDNNTSIPRLVIICMSKKLSQIFNIYLFLIYYILIFLLLGIDKKVSSISLLNEKLIYFEESGSIIIPVVIEGYNIVNYATWWPENLPMLEKHKLFVDLRDDKLNFNDLFKGTLYPQIIKQLEDWKGYSKSFFYLYFV
jgi:hypothetical protein